MDPLTISVYVPGRAAPKGSMDSHHRQSSPGQAQWARDVAAMALVERNRRRLQRLLPLAKDVPVMLRADFYFARGRTVTRPHPTTIAEGDLDKLERSVGDALKGVWLHDDSQIVHWDVWKRYETPARRPGLYLTMNTHLEDL